MLIVRAWEQYTNHLGCETFIIKGPNRGDMDETASATKASNTQIER
jgi:hypothetical protein